MARCGSRLGSKQSSDSETQQMTNWKKSFFQIYLISLVQWDLDLDLNIYSYYFFILSYSCHRWFCRGWWCWPCFEAWKESCGGIFSIWAERRDLEMMVTIFFFRRWSLVINGDDGELFFFLLAVIMVMMLIIIHFKILISSPWQDFFVQIDSLHSQPG